MKRELRGAAIGLAILGLLLVVALAARGSHPTGDGRVSERTIPYAVQESLVTVIAILYVIAVVIVLAAAFRFRERWLEPESHWLRNFVAAVALLLIITLGYWAIARGPLGRDGGDEQAGVADQRPTRDRVESVRARDAEFNWPIALSLAGLIVIGGTAVFLRARRTRPPTEPHFEDELVEAVETTIDELRAEADARRAVIRAYAGMERVLGRHGLERRRAETPFEYLARALRSFDVRESAIRSLTELFEYAKFSEHEVGREMKAAAVSALEDIRADLQPLDAAA